VKIISNLFYNKGVVIDFRNETNFFKKISIDKIIEYFELYGVILFKNFKLKPEDFIKFTDNFTKSYSVDAIRRPSRFNQKNVRNVDSGFHEIPLHSESSFTTTWPEIIWFMCVSSLKDSSATTICDGISVWNNLSQATKKFFLKNPLIFNNSIDLGIKKKIKKKKWFLDYPGTYDAFINWKNGKLNYKLMKFLVHDSRINNMKCFANHLLSVSDEGQIVSCTLPNGNEIPKKITSEIRNVTSKLTYDHKWSSNDLLMIDNKRFLHGRRAISRDDKRDIINVQTLQANFGYGSTTR
jgi:hypothetical protein